jgi:hypothetical protein
MMKAFYVLILLLVIGVYVYAAFAREKPRAQGRITGDFAQASALAAENKSVLILAVDRHPGY